MKNKRLIVIIMIVIAVLLVVLFSLKKNSIKSSAVGNAVNKTEVSKSNGYTLDLRVYGTVNKKSVSEIIRVDNHKDTDKNISITRIIEKEVDIFNKDKDQNKDEKNTEVKENYLVKDKKAYLVEGEKLKEVDKALYSDTEIYLQKIKSVKNITKEKEESIGEYKYQVYKGTISQKEMNSIIKSTDVEYEVKKDADVEIWEDSKGYIYKVYYRGEGLTIYASYFGYGTARGIDLDNYKSEA